MFGTLIWIFRRLRELSSGIRKGVDAKLVAWLTGVNVERGGRKGLCGPGCKCINCLNLPSYKQGLLNFSFECEDIDDDFEIFDDLDDIQDEDITDIIIEEQTDRQVDADDYWMYSDEDL